MTADVIALNVTVEENVPVIIDNVTKDFNGKVIIDVGGTKYDDIVKALTEIGRFQAGNYTADVTFYGDNNYNNRTYKVNFTVLRVDPVINVTINDVIYPANATALVNVSNNANGTVKVYYNGTEVGSGAVENGRATIVLNRLPGGVHEVSVKFITGDKYNNNATATAKFEVFKANTTIVITRSGNNVTATVSPDVEGVVTFIVNGRNHTAAIVNGNGTWADALRIGENYVTAIFEGNVNYTTSRNTTTFLGNKTNSTVNVTATTVVYGNASEITVLVPKAQTGFVRIVVIGTDINVTVEIVGGVAKFNATGLDVGRYDVNVTYLGDDTYYNSTNSTYFNITKAELKPVVIAQNVTVEENTVFVIDVTDDFKGNVTINVSGVLYDDVVKALVEAAKLPAGKYTANVTFYGDNNYYDKSVLVNFTVLRVDPVINVTIDDVTYPDYAVAYVNVSNKANGTVDVLLNGRIIGTKVMTNGVAVIDLEQLAGGVHEVAVRFTVDETADKYNNNISTTAKFEVFKANATVTITRYGNNVTATVTPGTTGNVTFIVNGKNKTVEIVNGNATWIDVLRIGENYVTAIFEGNVNYTTSRNTTTFLGNKTNSTVNVTATTVVYGNASEITVLVPKAQTGFVRIVVIGTDINVTVEIVDGVAKFNATGLNVGRYDVNVTYLGDETYYPNKNTTYFNITKAELKPVVIAQNVTVEENTVFVIDVTDDFKGNVTINVSGVLYDDVVKALVEAAKLPAGKYTANVTFYGDNNYHNKSVLVNFTVLRVDPVINVTIDDVTYPDMATALVNVSNNANGTVEIYFNGNKIGNASVENGVATVNIIRLAGGVYDVNVKFITSDDYNNNITTATKFVVYRANSTITIRNETRDVIATVSVNATGNVTFYVNGVKYENIAINNGEAILPNVLRIGNNTVVAVYEGDVNYTSSRNNTNFTVDRLPAKVNVTVKDTVYGKDIIITVAVPVNETGYVTITVNDKNYTAKLDQTGRAVFNITGLNVNRYTVNVTYSGDENYYNATNSTEFNVTKANMSAVVTGLNVTVEENIAFVIDNVTRDFTGKVNITVAGATYDGDIYALIDSLGKLEAGKYTADVVFYGDDNYNNRTYKVNFTVLRVDPVINVTIKDVKYPANATAIVNVSNNANGTIKVYFEGKEIGNGTMVNGKATVNLARLSGGVHEVVVKFITSDKYNNNITTKAKFEVFRANSTIVNITQHGNDVIATVGPAGVTGTVIFVVNGKNTTAEIINGNATCRGLLEIGDNYVTVIYNGNVNYTGSMDTVSFIGNRTNSTINVTATNVTYGNASQIVINVSVANGFVRVVINGTNINQIVELNNGIGIFHAEGLNIGNYTVTVTYLGDNTYSPSHNATWFIVSKANLTAGVIAQNVTVEQNTSFIVKVIEDFKGNVSITVDGVTYNGNVKTLIEMAKLFAGNKTAHVVFYGDNNYNVKEMDVNFTVYRVDPAINATVGDVTYPDMATALVNVSNRANGTVVVYLNGTEIGRGPIENGTASIDLARLPGGVHEVVVKFITSDDYNNNITTTAKFEVFRAASTVVLTQNGTDVIATVTSNATGTVTFYINGKEYNATVVNGNATIKGKLTIGNNTVVAIYNGDVNYTSSRNNTNFTVDRMKGLVNVTVKDTVYGKDIIITVAVPVNETGYVTINLNNKNYTAKLDETGKAVFNVTGLNVDKYDVTVYYSGDDIYYNATNSTEFNVTKANMSAVVTGLNVTVEENIAFVIDNVTRDFTGKVNITVNANSYNGDVKALIDSLGKLTAGNYTATVTFYGDNNYNNRTYLVNFTVLRVNPVINVTIADVIYPANATALVNVSNNANGTIKVYFEGKEIGSGAIVNGRTSIDLSRLPGGVHEVVVKFITGDKYNNNITATTKFEVFKENTTVVITRSGNNVTATVTPGTTGNVTFIVNGRNHTVAIVNGNATWADALRIGENYVTAIFEGNVNYTTSRNTTTATWADALRIGENYVTAIFEGNVNYTTSRNTTTFLGNKTNSTVNVTATTVVYGNASVITVLVPKAQTGFVRIVVIGTDINVTAEIIDGVATFNATGLNVGKYDVNVTYLGDDTYYANKNTTSFNITKANLTASVIGQNVTVEDNISFIVDVMDDFKGNVTITVDGKEYNGTVMSLIEMAKLFAGNKTAHVTFYGDNNYNVKELDVNFTVSRVDPTINVTVADVIYPANATAKVNVSNKANGTVEIYLNGTKVGTGNIENGTASIDLNRLPGGVHEVVVKFITSDDYNNNISTTTKFEVIRAASTVVLTQNGTDVIATVTTNATGIVTFYINGKEVNATIINGNATIKGNLTIGNNTVVAIYNGDVNYTSSRTSENFTVDKLKSLVNVTVNDTVYGKDIIITVAVPVNETGYVTITVNNKNYTAELDSTGKAVFNITGLNVDKYTVNVTYSGNDVYYNSTNGTTFNVTKANMSAVVTGLNVTVEDNIAFVIDNVTKDFAGQVNITVEGLTYDGDIKALINSLGKLEAGNYTAKVTFYGDNNYNIRNYTVNFTVSRVTPEINVTIADVIYDDHAVAKVNVSNKANGALKLEPALSRMVLLQLT